VVTGDEVAVTVCVPLAGRLVDRIRAVDPRVRILHEPELLPPLRFPGDHAGVAGFQRDAAGERRWRELLTAAVVTYGVPADTPAGLADLVRSAPGLRWVQGTQAGAGEQARRAGLEAADLERVALTTAAGVHGGPLAEFAMLGLLAGAKDLDVLLALQREHRWPTRWPLRQLAGRRLLVLGLGGIGREVALRAQAFGMHVTGVRRTPGTVPPPGVDQVRPLAELHAAAAETEDLVLALPGTVGTASVVDAGVLGQLPRGATVVNVGRGSALDEQALLAALDAGIVRLAVLDVTSTEPLPADSPLWDHPRVLLSPHTAALSSREDDAIVDLFCDNLRRWLDGRPLRNRVSSEHYY